MAVTLADGSIIHNYSAVDVLICLFRNYASLDMPAQCYVLDHLSSDLVFAMDWLQAYNPVIDWIGASLDLCFDSVSTTIFGTSAG